MSDRSGKPAARYERGLATKSATRTPVFHPSCGGHALPLRKPPTGAPMFTKSDYIEFILRTHPRNAKSPKDPVHRITIKSFFTHPLPVLPENTRMTSRTTEEFLLNVCDFLVSDYP